MAREKTTGFYFKLSPLEWEWIEKRMSQAGIRNKSAFIRKMCIDGYIVRLDLPELKEVAKLLRVTANNANQIARRVNSGGDAYRQDVAEVNAQLADIRERFGRALDSLAKLK